MLIDFHTHILPGADHGCDSPATAARQLALAERAKIAVLVATPHFYPNRHTVEDFLDRQRKGTECLLSVRREGQPRVILGAEVLVCRGMERMEGLDKLCIEGTDHVILLELPTNGLSEDILHTVSAISGLGFLPVLAHLDRYGPEIIDAALDLGVGIQLNAHGLLPLWHRKRWRSLVKEGRIWALGSDIHGTKGGFREFRRAVNILGKYADPLMERAQQLLNL